MTDLQFPETSLDIDKYVSELRRMEPSTDPARLAAAGARSVAVTPALVTLAKAIADFVDVSRVNGYSVYEAYNRIESLIDPLADVAPIDTSGDRPRAAPTAPHAHCNDETPARVIRRSFKRAFRCVVIIKKHL